MQNVDSDRMGTTTIRVDSETHARLVELSKVRNASLIDTVRDATEALDRLQFARRVADELAELRKDPDAWAAYLAEGEATEVRDGLN